MSERKSTKVKTNCLKCDKEMLVYPSKIKSGGGKFCSRSCGATAKTTHGLCKHPLYGVWDDMHQRCGNPKNKRYADYGGRGITICEEWRASFLSFHTWATANGWKEGLQLDREKNDEGYSPENCRFVTHQKNQQNKRKQKGASSQYKGVCWDSQTGKWRACYRHDGKTKHLGTFTVEEEAARVWDAEAIDMGRESSCLNFPAR